MSVLWDHMGKHVLAVTAFRPLPSCFGKDFGKLGLLPSGRGYKTLCPSFCVPCDEMDIPAAALILQREVWGWKHDLLSPPALPLGHLATAWRAEPLQTPLQKGRETWLRVKLGCVMGIVSSAAATSEKTWVGKSDTFLKVTFWKKGPKYLTSHFFLGKTYRWMHCNTSVK